jgi:hypothetical protein
MLFHPISRTIKNKCRTDMPACSTLASEGSAVDPTTDGMGDRFEAILDNLFKELEESRTRDLILR